MSIPRTRAWSGPAILSYGFRPFFLLGALYAAGSVLFWMPAWLGLVETHSLFAPVDWHIHEMLFGYLAAVVTGFLLTAIPNWTGRLPVQGWPLLGLVVLWLAGRVAVFWSSSIGWAGAAAIDCSFLGAVAIAAGTEIIAGRNWRNLKVLIPLAVLLSANLLFHIEARWSGLSDYSRRLGIAAAITLIMVIGGRIIPSFTRNWLVRENPGRLPVPFDRFDVGAILIAVAALLSWVLAPQHPVTAGAMALAAVLQLGRLARWAGDRTGRDPLVAILHLGYLFVPVGLALVALSATIPETMPAAAGFHALGGGAIGVMTLAVMTRASLGHTGRMLEAGLGSTLVFGAILAAAILRVVAAIDGNWPALVETAGVLWASAFAGYVVLHGRALLTPKG